MRAEEYVKYVSDRRKCTHSGRKKKLKQTVGLLAVQPSPFFLLILLALDVFVH